MAWPPEIPNEKSHDLQPNKLKLSFTWPFHARFTKLLDVIRDLIKNFVEIELEERHGTSAHHDQAF